MSRRPEADRIVSTVNTSIHGDQAGSRSQMALVSPCSVCKNFSAQEQGQAFCPRRYWTQQAEYVTLTGDGSAPQDHLTDSGTDDPEVLVNPVYSESSGTILLWVAPLENNPGILTPGFDTSGISCNLYPAVTQESQAQLFAGGTYRERDQLIVTLLKSYQQSASELVQIGGFARKVNFTHHFSLNTPQLDQLTSGT